MLLLDERHGLSSPPGFVFSTRKPWQEDSGCIYLSAPCTIDLSAALLEHHQESVATGLEVGRLHTAQTQPQP
jgi:hypothetical protein